MAQQTVTTRFEKIETKLAYLEDFLTRLQNEVVGRNAAMDRLITENTAMKERLQSISRSLGNAGDAKHFFSKGVTRPPQAFPVKEAVTLNRSSRIELTSSNSSSYASISNIPQKQDIFRRRARAPAFTFINSENRKNHEE